MDPIAARWLLVTSGTIALSAGDITGTITINGRPIAAGAQIEIRCGPAVYSAVTDSMGHYRVFVSRTGPCTLHLTYEGQAFTAELYSYDKAVRYDWSVEASGGTHRLRRT